MQQVAALKIAHCVAAGVETTDVMLQNKTLTLTITQK
jgi:hypothetical protein